MAQKKSILIGAAITALVAGGIFTVLEIESNPSPSPQPPAPEQEKDLALQYVFEIVRHGARAPLIASDAFPVPSEMLTPMGMRQRYLLGRYNYHEFSKNSSDFLSSMEIQSTDVFRTIQSGYSELNGVLAGNLSVLEGFKISEAQEADLNSSSPQLLPPFTTRRSHPELGRDAPTGFVPKPIFTYIDTVWQDDITTAACPFAQETNSVRKQDDSTFEDYLYLRDDLKPEYKETFNLTQNETDDMSFYQSYLYSDAVFSQRFEEVPQVVNWTDNQIYMVNNTQKHGLIDGYTSSARQFMISKLLSLPIREIADQAEEKNTSAPYYRMYSAHDTQISNVLTQIEASFNYTYIPYASNIYFELYQDLNSEDGEDFYVKTRYNGLHRHFGDCKDLTCAYEDWFNSMNDTLIVFDEKAMKEGCEQTYPPSEMMALLQ